MLEEQTQTVDNTQDVNLPNPFDDASWVETSPVQQFAEVQEIGSETTTTETVSTEEAKQDSKTDFNTDAFVKENFGYENLNEAKADFEELKKLKGTLPKEQEFANEESKTLYQAWLEGKTDEVLDYLSNQKKLNRLASGEVTQGSAEEILKLSIKQKNQNLSEDEVDFVFNERFSLPKEPTLKEDEYEEDYQARVSEWETRISAIQKKLVIEAKMAQPELQKTKGELVLPSIQKANQITEAQQQEELQKAEVNRKAFEQALESEYKSFNGFNVAFKDESAGIEIPISYVPTDEEKSSLKNALSDFDSSEYFGNRWFSKDGKPQIKEMMADKYFLENKDKILQKVANEAAQQMRLKMIALQSNINLKNNGQQQTFMPDNNLSDIDNLAKAMFAA